jgi:DNA-binding transcriptional LysR family regulator
VELRQLAHFIAVAEDGSFTRAAQRLGYVQSALSVSIQSLERELDVRLLDRTTHRVQLTDAGQVLLPSARAALAAAEELRNGAAAVKGVLRGTLRIAIMQSFALLDVPRLLGEFHRRHPGVEITMRPAAGGSASLLDDLAAGEFDVGFVADDGRPRGLQLFPLAREPLLLVHRPGIGPDAAEPVPLSALQSESFIDFPRGWGTRTALDRAFADEGLARRVSIEVADVEVLVRIVREGLGVALTPESLLPRDDPQLVRRVVTPEVFWDVVVALPGDRPPSAAARAFMELVHTARFRVSTAAVRSSSSRALGTQVKVDPGALSDG